MKGGLSMEKNMLMNPTPTLRLALYSAIETLWAIGCSAAASPWVQKATDIYFRILNQKPPIIAAKYKPKTSIKNYEAPFITHLDSLSFVVTKCE